MDDFTAWLEHELLDAPQRNRRPSRPRLHKTRSILAVAASVAVVIAVAGGAILALASHHGQKTATHRHPHRTAGHLPPSVAALARHFAVLRGPTVQLSPQVSQTLGRDGSLEPGLPGQAHRVTRPAGTVWIVPAADGGLCIAFTEPGTRAPAGATCGDLVEASRAGIRMTGWRPGLGLAAGVVPNGISAAQINLAAGTTITAPVEHNVYAATAHSQITSVHLIARGAANPATPACRTDQLSIRTGHSFAGLGTAGAYIRFTNQSRRACEMTGWPHVIGLTRSGAQVNINRRRAAGAYGSLTPKVSAHLTSAPVVRLGPGQHADAVFGGTDHSTGSAPCGPSLIWLRVRAPTGGPSVRISAFIAWLGRYMPTCGPIGVSPVLPARDLYHG